jgi:hypothetical protein
MPSKHKGSRPRNQAEYKRNKLILLQENPFCHYCGKPATEADHVIEVDRWPQGQPGVNSLDNLRSACRGCNAARGNKYRAARDAGNYVVKPNTSKENKGNHSPRFFHSDTEAPVSTNPISHKGLLELAPTGRYQPRLETTTHSGHQSRAADIADFAERVLGMPLMSWQRHCLEGLTAYDDQGKWLHRIGLISVARQNGKSLLSSAVIGHWLTKETELRGQPQTVISVSHKLDLTAAQFNYLAPILEAKFGAEVSWSYGRQKVTMPNGSVWHIRAATPAAGHGYSCDLITADEVWQISEAAIDDGLLPSQRARRNPLCLLVSTAGTQESTALLRWRDQGLKAIDTGEKTNLYFAEFSPPPTLDPMTVEAWEYANPALAGGLIELDVIQGEAQGPNRSAFLRASVNLWQAVNNGWLAPGIFEGLSTDEKAPPGGVLAVEMALDESTYTAVRAVQIENKTHVVLAFVAETVTELWEKVEQQVAENPNLRLAIVPVLENSCPIKYEGRRVIVGYKELLKWTSAVRAMILENKLTHNNQQLLNSHVERAVLIREKNGITVSSLRSPGPIEACRCMIWAAALASKPQAIGKPVIVTNYR